MPDVPATTNAGLPALSADDLALMGAASGDMDHNTTTTLAPPYLVIVQGSSDYVKRGEPSFVQGAAAGDIMDTLLLQPMQECYFIPCKFRDESSEWKPNRGGLVKKYFADLSKYEASAKKGADDFDGMTRVTAEGNDITMVPTYYGLIVNIETGRARPAILTMGGTQAKTSRKWNNLMDALEFNGPNGPVPLAIYAKAWKLTTIPQKGRDNTTFAGWKYAQGPLTLTLPNGRDLWTQAQEIRKQVEAGLMQGAAEPRDITPPAEPRTPRASAAAAASDDDIPF